MIRLLSILILMLLCRFVQAQKPVVYDTAAIEIRSLDASTINRYKADPAFQYDTSLTKPRSWWERFWSRFWERVGRMLSSGNGIITTKIFLVAIAVIIMVYFVLVLSGMGREGLFGKKSNSNPLDYTVSEEDIHSINFDAAIEEAVSNKNYRFAVRLLYLRTLKKLTDDGVINWQVNKTNIAYLKELNGKAFQYDFGNLTLQFENNWYGDLPIDEKEFQTVRNEFNRFNQNLA